MTTKPLLSIVIANYNYGRFLPEALDSIISQKPGDDVEIIIIDGASTDNSVEVIQRYANGLPQNTERRKVEVKGEGDGEVEKIGGDEGGGEGGGGQRSLISFWVSEKDGGQSNAFNKGFSHAHGRFLTWLNADDIMPKGCLARVLSAMRCHPECEWFTGNFYRFDSGGRILEVGWGPHWYPACFQSPHAPLVIFGPTTFFSRKIYEQVGRIDESLHYIMDNDLWYRFMVSGVKQRRINCFCWGFRMHEESKTAQFGDHVLEKRIADKMNAERDYLLKKSGYVQSKFWRYFLLLCRVFDGSLLRRQFLKLSFRHVSEKGVSV